MEKFHDTILIIEDDADLIELIAEKVNETGHLCKSFGNAFDAINWLKGNEPLLIILDYNLPDLNGLEFISSLKNNGITLPPFIVATGQGDERTAVELMKQGARDYIVKDSNFLDMVAVVVDRTTKDIRNEIKLQQTKEELDELSQFNNQIIECAHEGIVVYDTDFRFVLWNKFMEDLTGYKSVEVVGKYVLDVFPLFKSSGIYENIAKALHNETGKEIEFFFDLKSKNKSGWLSDFTSPLKNTKNEVIGAISAVHNITDRKNAEAEALKIAKHYQTIIENAPDGFVLLNESGQFKYISPSARRIFGFNATDEVVIDTNQQTHPDDLPLVLSLLDHIKTHPTIISTIQYRFSNKQGEWIWVESTFSNLLSNPNVESIVINFRDITDRKTTEIALSESEQKFRSITEQTNDFIGIADLNGNIIYASSASFSLFGYTPDEMLGTSFEQHVIKEEKERAQQAFSEMFITKRHVKNAEFQLLRKDRSIFYGEINGSIYSQGGIKGVMVVIHDITERKETENYLIQSKTVLQKLVESSTELIESNTENIDFKKITNTIREISGASYASFNLFEHEGVIFKTVGFSGISDIEVLSHQFLGFNVREKNWEYNQNKSTRTENQTTTKFDSLLDLARQIIPDEIILSAENMFDLGEVHVVKISKNNIVKGDFTLIFKKGESIKNPEIVELYANQVGLYIERQQADVLLKESEKKYRILFADNPQPMLIYDVETLKILEVNTKAQKHYGYSRNEFLSMSILDIHPEEEIPSIKKEIEKIRNGQNVENNVSKHIKKNGEVIFAETNTMATPTFGKNARHIIVNDITLRKMAEDNLKTSLSLLNATLESTADGILVVDSDGKATIYNQKFAKMWNIPNDLLDQKLDEQLLRYVFTQIQNPQDFLDKVGYLYRNPDMNSIDMIQLEDGRTFERFSLPQRIGNTIEGRVWSFRDISERLKAEEDIKQKIDEMTRFHNLAVGRELTMIELKKEINEMYTKAGLKEKYKIIE